MRNPIIRPLLLALALPFALTACHHADSPLAGQNTAASTVATDVITVSRSNQAEMASFPGTVNAIQQIQVASRIMGYVRAIHVDTGETVKRGQLLVTIDPSDIQGQVSMASAGLAQAEAALADAKTDYDRFGELYREEAIPKAQWDKIRLQYAVAQQQVNAARASHATAEAQMSYAAIRAPFPGVITQRMTSQGALAAPGQPLLMLVNPDHLDVQTQVPEDVFGKLHTGEKVAMHIENRDVYGHITALVSAADPATHTHLVKISLPAQQTFDSGQFVQVNFLTGEARDLRVPDSAIVIRAGIPGVFVVDRQNTAHFRMIRTGESASGMTVITAGLTTGERIVSQPPVSLASGDHINATGADHV